MDAMVKMWVGFIPNSNDPAEVAAAKLEFDTKIWPTAYQSQWNNLLVSFQTSSDLMTKLNDEFNSKVALWPVDPTIKPPAVVMGPFVNQAWRVGSGGLHEVLADPVDYTPIGGGQLKQWKFRYKLANGGERSGIVYVEASWTLLKKLPETVA